MNVLVGSLKRAFSLGWGPLLQRLVCCAFHGPVSGTPFKAHDFFSTGTEIGGMACRKMTAPGSYIADSDLESQPDHPTASGGLPEYSAEGLEQLLQVATEIIEGTAARR